MREPAPICRTVRGDGPLVATAIHDGHTVRDEVRRVIAVDEATRLREEDPCTGLLAALAPTRVVGRRSRFEVDLNRPRDKAVYLQPADAWGLSVWSAPPSPGLITRSVEEYDRFYEHVGELLTDLAGRVGRFLVLDLHSYNHRRGGPEAPPDPPTESPEINLGTGSVDLEQWGPLVDRFRRDLSQEAVNGHLLDVRENVKFAGGYFSRWVNETFEGTGVALAIELKKTFMDEWTGRCDRPALRALRGALSNAAAGALEELGS